MNAIVKKKENILNNANMVQETAGDGKRGRGWAVGIIIERLCSVALAGCLQHGRRIDGAEVVSSFLGVTHRVV